MSGRGATALLAILGPAGRRDGVGLPAGKLSQNPRSKFLYVFKAAISNGEQPCLCHIEARCWLLFRAAILRVFSA
jgi:hypothetical protein